MAYGITVLVTSLPPPSAVSSTWIRRPNEAQSGRRATFLQQASLGRYVRLGEETSARITAEADPPNAAAPADAGPPTVTEDVASTAEPR